ncbi:MAG: hypothetical protein JWO06_1472 [Bacteroidota bacterium]|nr:hypothetical protein [Bacteroidota bacterium]
MRFYLGVTNNSWFNFLSASTPDDVNFWQPGGNSNFKLLVPGAPFLFKLKSPLNAIAGIGFFSSHTHLPLSVAWDIFETKNGCANFSEFQRLILTYRSDKENINPQIGCIVLTNPIFFEKSDWIETPSNWGSSIVQGKSYTTEEPMGKEIWDKVVDRLSRYLYSPVLQVSQDQLMLEEPPSPVYGRSVLAKVRVGQGAFRVLVTDSYNRKCSVTGEKTLPVLEAAHIKPYSMSGPNSISNGLLLRSDIHKLFDQGYITLTKEHKVEVSKRIKEEFSNGKEYYQFHGKSLLYLPPRTMDQPSSNYIDWHNVNVFKD